MSTAEAGPAVDAASDNGKPDTVVLVHGLWVTPRSWEGWIAHYEGKGLQVIAPPYPGFDVEVEALNEDPAPVERLDLKEVVDSYEEVLKGLDKPPIIMGHSAGGAITQILLHRGYGASAVALNSAPTEGVKIAPLSQVRSTFPVLKNPANRHRAVGFDKDQWHYAFGNALPREESDRLYERYAIPAPGRIVWNGILANLQPGHQDAWVDYHNDERAPLLFMSASEDHIMPPSVQRSNAKHYKSSAVTEQREYEGHAHLMPAEPGWEQIADEALEWALEHAKVAA